MNNTCTNVGIKNPGSVMNRPPLGLIPKEYSTANPEQRLEELKRVFFDSLAKENF